MCVFGVDLCVFCGFPMATDAANNIVVLSGIPAPAAAVVDLLFGVAPVYIYYRNSASQWQMFKDVHGCDPHPLEISIYQCCRHRANNKFYVPRVHFHHHHRHLLRQGANGYRCSLAPYTK